MECLAAYQIMDTPPEPAFDSLVQLTAQVFKVPVVLLSFLDTHRQWIKAAYGTQLTHLARAHSFCHHTIQGNEVFEVQDTSHPQAPGPAPACDQPYRFYAGAPLITSSGHRIGTLWLLDLVPRSLTPQERTMLQTLADQVMPRLELQVREQELEQKTRRTQAFSQKLDRYRAELDQIAYAVSHELKSPLRAIHNLAEWVAEELEDSASHEIKGKLGLMRHRVHRLENLFNGLLELSAVSKSQQAEAEQVDTRQLVQRIGAHLQKSHAFTLTVSGAMPTLFTQKKPLEAVFLHLLKNAVHHNTKPGLHLEVGCETPAGAPPQFYVRDNGKGIPAEYHQRIFDLFKTVHPATRQAHTGIGLTLVRKMVEERDARVWVASAENQGATFYFTWNA